VSPKLPGQHFSSQTAKTPKWNTGPSGAMASPNPQQWAISTAGCETSPEAAGDKVPFVTWLGGHLNP